MERDKLGALQDKLEELEINTSEEFDVVYELFENAQKTMEEISAGGRNGRTYDFPASTLENVDYLAGCFGIDCRVLNEEMRNIHAVSVLAYADDAIAIPAIKYIQANTTGSLADVIAEFFGPVER